MRSLLPGEHNATNARESADEPIGTVAVAPEF